MRIKSKTNKTPRRIISATKTEGHNYTIIRAYVSLRYVIPYTCLHFNWPTTTTCVTEERNMFSL